MPSMASSYCIRYALACTLLSVRNKTSKTLAPSYRGLGHQQIRPPHPQPLLEQVLFSSLLPFTRDLQSLSPVLGDRTSIRQPPELRRRGLAHPNPTRHRARPPPPSPPPSVSFTICIRTVVLVAPFPFILSPSSRKLTFSKPRLSRASLCPRSRTHFSYSVGMYVLPSPNKSCAPSVSGRQRYGYEYGLGRQSAVACE